MNALDAIKSRRSVKHYDASFTIPQEDVDVLLNHALESPTSFNVQHWRFVQVEDTVLRQELRAAAWDQAQVTDASLLFLICADVQAWDKTPERYWKDAPHAAQDILVPMIKPFYEGKEELQRDEAMRSCGIAAQSLMLAAQSMGYESCPMVGFDFAKVAELIKLPEDHLISMCVAIGKGSEEAWERPGQLKLDEVLIKNTFS